MLGTTTYNPHTMAAWLPQFTEPCYKQGETQSHLVTLFIHFSCPDVAVCLCTVQAIMFITISHVPYEAC